MLQFILGVLIGSIVGFAVCAICSAAGADDRTEPPVSKETGESDARK